MYPNLKYKASIISNCALSQTLNSIVAILIDPNLSIRKPDLQEFQPITDIYQNNNDIFLKSINWFIDGWDGFTDWANSSPINESNNYDLLKYEINDYSRNKRALLVGKKTNEYRTLMYGYRKIGNDVQWHLFDDKGYHFGTMYNMDGSFKHDGSVDQFGRRKV